eukprot:3071485-Rhodomonas_salina.1
MAGREVDDFLHELELELKQAGRQPTAQPPAPPAQLPAQPPAHLWSALTVPSQSIQAAKVEQDGVVVVSIPSSKGHDRPTKQRKTDPATSSSAKQGPALPAEAAARPSVSHVSRADSQAAGFKAFLEKEEKIQ